MGEWKEKKNRAPDLKYLERESLKKGDSDTGTAADVELVMKKYDRESNTRVWQGKPASIIRWLSVLFSVYSIYVTLFSTALPEIRLSMFLGMILILGYLHYPIQKGDGRINHMPWYDWVLMAVGAVPFFYFAANAHAIIKLATRVTKNPVMVLMAILAVVHVGGWDAIVKAMDPKAMSLFAVDKLGTIPALSLAMVIGVGVLATPSYRQRIYSGKDVSSVRRSFVYTGVLYLFFSVLPAIIGMAAWTMNPNLENSNYAFLFATSFLPAILGLVVLIAGLSATMSSASSDAIAAVAIMMRDVYTLVTGKMPPAHKAITLSRWMLAFVIGLAMIFALTSNDIISYITKMISMLMSGLFVCSILGRFWLRFNWQGALTALLSGMLVSIVVLVKADWLAYWGNPCIPSVVGSFVSAIFVTVMTPASKISRQQALEMITQEREGEAIPAKTVVQVSGETQ